MLELINRKLTGTINFLLKL